MFYDFDTKLLRIEHLLIKLDLTKLIVIGTSGRQVIIRRKKDETDNEDTVWVYRINKKSKKEAKRLSNELSDFIFNLIIKSRKEVGRLQ